MIACPTDLWDPEKGRKAEQIFKREICKANCPEPKQIKTGPFSQQREICTKKLEEEEDAKAKTLRTRPFHNGRSS